MADTPGRLLRLLSLLQTPREWPGPELAARLEVSERTVRNDVERLRSLGYPVSATRGRVGGYRLAAGTAMPPLLLDDEEAVAVAVSLATASSGAVAGLEESSLRALTKLQQVLPRRLKDQVEALQAATVRVRWSGRRPTPAVDSGLLTQVAAASGAREVLRFAYADHAGAGSERRVEPYRMVSMGSRWYLVAFDLDRDDWRTFRLDRMSGTRTVGHRFRARPLPEDDLAAYVARKTRQVRQHVSATVRVHAPAAEVEDRVVAWNKESVEVVDEATCLVRLAGQSMGEIAFWLGTLDNDFEVVDSPELAEAVSRLAERYARAV